MKPNIWKQCRRCKITKEVKQFHKLKQSKDGLRYFCKSCSLEYKRLKYHGLNAKTVDLLPRSKRGGKGFIHASGYHIINKKDHPNCWKNGYIAIHTITMTEKLGRPLKKSETVHHINGIKHDNRIENLELWDKRHGPGQRVEDKVKWCIDFLNEYGYKVVKE